MILHTYFTDETVVRCVETVRSAAERAGRDPAAVRVWSCFATIGDHLPYEARMMKTVGRCSTNSTSAATPSSCTAPPRKSWSPY